MDVNVDGRDIPAVMQVTKQSFVYAFNRLTGEPLWPIEERPVPQSTVPAKNCRLRSHSHQTCAVRHSGYFY